MNDQKSLVEQLQDVVNLANKNDLYDAADWVQNHINLLELRGITCIKDIKVVRKAFEEFDNLNCNNTKKRESNINFVCTKYKISKAELIEYEQNYSRQHNTQKDALW
jgi:hypothetical protein